MNDTTTPRSIETQKVVSRHRDFAPLGTVVAVTPEEAKLMVRIGRAELLREGAEVLHLPAREIRPVYKQQHHGKRR
jgi:hypothetical protein